MSTILEGLEVLASEVVEQYDLGYNWKAIAVKIRDRLTKLQWNHRSFIYEARILTPEVPKNTEKMISKDADTIVRLHNNGHTFRAIAASMGTTYKAVSNVYYRKTGRDKNWRHNHVGKEHSEYVASKRGCPLPDANLVADIVRRKETESFAQIGKALNISPETVKGLYYREIKRKENVDTNK